MAGAKRPRLEGAVTEDERGQQFGQWARVQVPAVDETGPLTIENNRTTPHRLLGRSETKGGHYPAAPSHEADVARGTATKIESRCSP